MFRRVILELLLFMLPFAVFYIYRAASKDLSIRDRWPLTTLVAVGGILAVGALVLGPMLQPSDEGKCYLAARYENGVTIPARKVDCAEVTVPDRASDSTSSPAPVAPRDLERER